MSIVTATIKSEGQVLPAQYALLSIEVNREVNRIPTAEIALLDGDSARREFKLSEESFFEPGKEIEILLRYEGEGGRAQTVFKGLVVRQTLEANHAGSTLTVGLEDQAFGMTKARHTAIFKDKSDTDVFKGLIQDNGLEAAPIPKTKPVHKEIIQYDCTDWDFMLTRAELNQLLVVVEDGKIGLEALKISGAPKHTIEYGISTVYSFELEADASYQYQSIESVSWDIKTQKLSKVNQAADFSLSQSNLKGKAIAGQFPGKAQRLQTNVPLAPEETKAWADAAMARTRMSLLRGTISVVGLVDIALLDMLELKGVGKRFNGKTLVTGFKHTVDENGWQTHIQFGLKADSFARAPNISALPASGLIPPVHGLQLGVVAAFEEDKDGKEFRVRVQLAGVADKKGTIWARLSSPEAGLGADKGRGYFFRPEPGDEVVVGFFNNDPRQAVVLGALFSSKNVPPKGWEKLDKENAFKGIVSKTGITFEIDDQAQTLTLRTSEEQSILLDEKNKKIEIIDLNKNTITLNEDGISLKAAGKLAIEADGDLEFKGKNVTIDASAKVEIKGSQVDVK